MVIEQSTILQQIVKENRKLLQDNLKNVLSIADHLFEKGYFKRTDYHDIDQVEDARERCNKFLDILVSNQDDSIVDVLIDFLGSTTGNIAGRESADTVVTAPFLLLHEKLKLSKNKFSPKDVSRDSNKLDNTTTTIPPTVLIDSADFTLTQKSLEEICNLAILKNEKVKRNWATVISNMNGLEDVELLTYNGESTESGGIILDDSMPLKMRLRFKGEHQTIQNYVHCINWEEIAHKCFALWKERNGTNSTFFSLVGIFQHSQLIGIADWLLDRKDAIQKGTLSG